MDNQNMDKELAEMESTKACPYCAETIKLKAIKCRFCNSDLSEETSIAKPSDLAASGLAEYTLYEARLHWLIYAKLALIVIVFVFFGRAIIFVASDKLTADQLIFVIWFVWLCVQAPLVILALIALKHYFSDFCITNKRLITKSGILSRRTNEILLEKIETVSVNQGPIERLVDSGDVVLTGTGSAHKPIRNIASPITFRTELTTAMAHNAPKTSEVRNFTEQKKSELFTILTSTTAIFLVSLGYSLTYHSPTSVGPEQVEPTEDVSTSQPIPIEKDPGITGVITHDLTPQAESKQQLFVEPNGTFEFELPPGLFALDDNGGTNKFGQGVYLHSTDDNCSATVQAYESESPGTVAEALKTQLTDCPDWKVTMKKVGKDWFALSGYSGDDIFYQKTILKDGQQISFLIQYKKADKVKFASATEVIAASFKPISQESD